jgi:hypothetical protein
MTERKLSILRALLARVQERSNKAPPAPLAAAPDIPPKAALAPASVDQEEQLENEPVPPSAPRVREAAVERLDEDRSVAASQALAQETGEASSDEEELEEEEMEITISDHPPPDPGMEPVAIPPAASVSSFTEPVPAESEEGGLVLEHETPPPAMVAEAPLAPAARDDLSWTSIPAAQRPSPVAVSQLPLPAEEDTVPAVFPPRIDRVPPPEVPPAPVDRAPLPPEVAVADIAPEVHRPPPPRGPVGTFVEQSRTFSPRSFGELVSSSLELGRDV